MASRISIHELSGVEQPGVWVSPQAYGSELPSAEEVRFVIERSASGLWSAAIRGFNGGEPIDLLPAGDREFNARAGGVEDKAFEFFDQVLEVSPEETDTFQEIVRQPEARKGMLVQVLEAEQPGVWDMLSPAEYNEYDSFGQLVYNNPDEAALSWGDFTGDPANGVVSAGGYAGYVLNKAKPSRVLQNGPLFYVAPLDKSQGVRVSSIRERTSYFPKVAELASPLTPENESALASLREAFEFGLDPLVKETESPLTAQIHGYTHTN